MADTLSSDVPSMSLTDQIVADTNAALVQSSQGESQLLRNLGVAESATREIQKLSEQRAVDIEVIKSAENAAVLRAQQYTLNAANAAGVNPAKSTDFLLETIGKFQLSAQKTQEKLDTYNRKKDSKFADDPLQWIIDGFTINQAAEDVKAAADQTQIIQSQISGINSIISSTANTSMQIKESVTAASADAATRLASNEAQQIAITNSMNAVKYNSAALEASMNASKERLALQYSLKSAQNQEFSQQMALKHFAQQNKEFDWRVEEKNAVKAAKEEAVDLDSYVIDKINLGRAGRGFEPISGPAIKANLALFKSGASKELAIDYKNGERTRQSGNTFLGATPSESLEVIKQLPYNPPTAHNRVIGILKTANDLLANNKLLAGSKDEGAKAQFIDDEVKKLVAADYASGSKSPDNLFHVGDLASYLTLTTVAQLPITKKLLEPAAASGTSLDDPRKVLDLSIAAVKKKLISSNDLADLATVYQVANDLNIRSSNFLGFGIGLPNAGRNFFLKTSTFGNPIDLTNSQDILRFMSKELAAQIGKDQSDKARELYGRPGSPNAMRRLMQAQQPADPGELKGN